jgi:hypothetical protein
MASSTDSQSQGRARRIMGKNFLGIEDVRLHLGVRFTAQQLERLSVVPFSTQTLKECRKTHLLFPGYPFCIRDLFNRFPILFSQCWNIRWFWYQAFVTHGRVIPLWHLLRKTAVPGSMGKSLNLETLLSHQEALPSAWDLTYAVILAYRARGERLLESIFLRCSSEWPDGAPVFVGDTSFCFGDLLLDSPGLCYTSYRHANPLFGIAASRLF